MNVGKRLFVMFVMACFTNLSLADTTTSTSTSTPSINNVLCPDANIWGASLINNICWSCMFPMRIFGVTIRSGDVPDQADNDIACECSDNLGIPHYGTVLSDWQPARIIELVRKPYCSPVMGGAVLMDGALLQGVRGGYDGSDSDEGGSSGAFYNYHYWAFPLDLMMDLLSEPNCNSGGYTSLDIMYLSELDPTWNEDELAFYTNPEAAAFANPVAIAACAVDCIHVATSLPEDNLVWCAGCWGDLYPFTGNVDSAASPPRDTSLLATRVLAALHRRGLAYKTYGSGNLCGGSVSPMIPKQQYKMSMMYPIPESSGASCCHRIGESTFQWGEWRNIPGIGEDFVYLVWRYTDCCLIAF